VRTGRASGLKSSSFPSGDWRNANFSLIFVSSTGFAFFCTGAGCGAVNCLLISNTFEIHKFSHLLEVFFFDRQGESKVVEVLPLAFQ